MDVERGREGAGEGDGWECQSSSEGRSSRVVSSSKKAEGGGKRSRERGCEDHPLALPFQSVLIGASDPSHWNRVSLTPSPQTAGPSHQTKQERTLTFWLACESTRKSLKGPGCEDNLILSVSLDGLFFCCCFF